MPWERCALKSEANHKNNPKMFKHKHYKKRKIYIPDLLRPSEIRQILDVLGIAWQNRRVKQSGWVKIRSPFREDRNPSFSLNINKGCFMDFAYPEIKGDIVRLVMLVNKCSRTTAEQWILNELNLNSKINLHI